MGHFPFCPVPSSLLLGPAFPIDFAPSLSLSPFCRLLGCDGEGRGWIVGARRVRALDDGTLYATAG